MRNQPSRVVWGHATECEILILILPWNLAKSHQLECITFSKYFLLSLCNDLCLLHTALNCVRTEKLIHVDIPTARSRMVRVSSLEKCVLNWLCSVGQEDIWAGKSCVPSGTGGKWSPWSLEKRLALGRNQGCLLSYCLSTLNPFSVLCFPMLTP